MMSPAAIVAHLVIVVAVVAATATLGALHDLSGEVVSAILTGVLALVGGSAIATASVGTAVNGKMVVNPAVIEELQQTLRQAVDHLAGARKQIDGQAKIDNGADDATQ